MRPKRNSRVSHARNIAERILKNLHPLLLLLALPLALGATPLPRSGPIPDVKPGTESAPPTPPQGSSADSPSPEKRDQDKADEAPPSDDGQPDPATEPEAEIPTPEPKPTTKEQPPPAPEDKADGGEEKPTDTAPENGKADSGDGKGEEVKAPPPPPPIDKEDAQALRACMADLTALGTKFETVARIDDGNGCGIDRPIEVAEVLPGIETGGAQMRCETARALGHWLKDTVHPALKIAMPARRITGITTGSTYACRLRNGASTGKISEHARGNAIDIVAFHLDDGSEITMKPRDEDGTMEGAFQRTATTGACLHFSTVLSPGSDAAHQDHLHLDVLQRKSGYRYCR